MTQHDLVHISVAEETMVELRAITEELQALRPSVVPLAERAYRVFQGLVDEVEGQPFPEASVEVGPWDVLHQDPDIATFRSAVGDLARDFVAVAGGTPVGDPDWLKALQAVDSDAEPFEADQPEDATPPQ